MMKNENNNNGKTNKTSPKENPHQIFIHGINLYKDNYSLLKSNKKNKIEAFLLKLLEAAPDQLKIEISEEISTLDYAPLKIVRYLALKNIAIAKSILIHCEVLTERDLLVITSLRDNQHRAAIATRKDVTFPLSYKLVEMGNDDVICALTANQSALISQKTFRLIGDKITMKTALEEIITTRNDISTNSLEYLLEKFSSSELFKLLKTSNSKLQSIVNDKIKKLGGDKDGISTGKSKQDEKLESLYKLKNTYSSKHVTEQTLVSAINSDEHDIVICLFSILSELNLEETLDVISNADARKLAIASKAKNIRINTVKTFLKSKIWETTLSNETVSDAIRTYKGLRQNIACELLNKNKWAGPAMGAKTPPVKP